MVCWNAGKERHTILLEKGRFFTEHLSCPEFTASAGSLSHFKSRHGISLRLLLGEAASVNTGAVSAVQLQVVISTFAPCDVYNIDETGLFYRMPPSKSLSQGPRHGAKQFKDSLTVALCTNADGSDKIKPFVIGKSAQPGCFKDFAVSTYVTYQNNTIAWMTGYLFSEWLHHFDRYIKQRKNRQVLLLMDNVASHFPDVSLECVKLHYFPPNTTSHLQPHDACIIRAFKAWYRQLQVKRLIELLEEEKKPHINLKEAIRYIALAWQSITSVTIQNCWRHTGIMPCINVVLEDVSDPAGDIQTLLSTHTLLSAACQSASDYY